MLSLVILKRLAVIALVPRLTFPVKVAPVKFALVSNAVCKSVMAEIACVCDTAAFVSNAVCKLVTSLNACVCERAALPSKAVCKPVTSLIACP